MFTFIKSIVVSRISPIYTGKNKRFWEFPKLVEIFKKTDRRVEVVKTGRLPGKRVDLASLFDPTLLGQSTATWWITNREENWPKSFPLMFYDNCSRRLILSAWSQRIRYYRQNFVFLRKPNSIRLRSWKVLAQSYISLLITNFVSCGYHYALSWHGRRFICSVWNALPLGLRTQQRWPF